MAVLQSLDISKGTGFNYIKRRIRKGSDATNHSIKRLCAFKFVIKSGRHYYLTQEGVQLARGNRSDFPSYTRVRQTSRTKQKIRDGVRRNWIKRKAREYEKRIAERKKRVTFFILWTAGNGVAFETVLSERKLNMNPVITSSTEINQILSNQIISPRPFTKADGILLNTASGVSIDDFFSKHAINLNPYCYLSEYQFKRSELKKCINELEHHGILELKEVYDPNLQGKVERYQIADSCSLLQKLIEDLSILLRVVLKRKGLVWQKRDLSKNEWSWLGFFVSSITRRNIRSYHREVRRALAGKQSNKDLEKTILIMVEYERNPVLLVKSLDTKINGIWKNITKKYHDVKDRYPYDLMLGHAYP